MNLMAVREALQPGASIWRRVLLSLVAVTALIVGLIAMHALNLESSHHAPDSSVTSVDHHDAAPATESAFGHANDCSGDGCDTGHLMSFMACVLALLVASIALGAVANSTVARWIDLRMRLRRFVGRGFAAPPPPSLHALSISRT